MTSKKIDNYISYLEQPFLIVFEIVLIARMISLYYLVNPRVDSIISWILVAISVLLFTDFLLARLKNKRFYFTDLLLVLFLLVLVISTLINRQFGLFENAKLIMWQGIYFFVVAEIGRRHQDRKFYLPLEYTLIAIWFICVTISLTLFITKFHYTLAFHKLYYGVRIGIIQNRLYGIFVDPNYSSTISLVTILMSLHVLNILDNGLLKKAFLWINIFFQLSFIILSGSRSSLIQLLVVTFAGVFYFFYQKRPTDVPVKRIFVSLLIALFSSVIIFAGMQGIKQPWLFVANHVQIEQPKLESEHESDIKEDNEDVTLVRGDTEDSSNISNGRFKLWKSSLEIFRKNPIFGASPKNLFKVAKQQLPKTFIAIRQQTSHNFFFYLLATTGISGTVIYLIILIITVKGIFIRLFKRSDLDFASDFVYRSETILVILISACFVTDMILMNRLAAFIFWLFIGYLWTGSKRINNK